MKHIIDTVANQSNSLIAGATVTVFVSGTNSLAVLYSDDGLTIKPNPVTTNANGVFDFFVADGVYDLQVSGPNIATIRQVGLEIADITQAFGTDVNWQTENINFVNQTSVPGRPPTGSVELYSLASNKHIFLQDDTGTITDLTTGTGGGGGNLPGAPANALQKNSGTNTFVASNVVDDGTKVAINSDALFKGPSPYTDIRAFGARSINAGAVPAIPGITATMNAGQSNVTLSSASAFQNGDGVTIFNAGPATTLTVPIGLTVTPMQSSGPTGSAGSGTQINPSSGGSTPYSYSIIAVDKFGGATAASTVASTSTGTALGSQSFSITGFARSGNVVTATTATPHGLANGTVFGTLVVITAPNGADQFWFGGTFHVTSILDGTHFTYTTGQDVADGAASTSLGGGTLFYFAANRLAWTAVPNADRYYIYGRTAGSLTLLGTSLPNNPGTNQVVTVWDDFGPLMMANQTFPFYVPSTPPAAPLAQNLTTTIASGGGTTNLTLANAATSSVSGATILLDSAPNILAAKQASGGLLYFPPGQYVINSHLILGFVSMELAGCNLVLNDTLEVAGPRIFGMIGPQAQDATAFGWPTGGIISVNRAPIGLWDNSGSLSFYEGLHFSGSSNAQILHLLDGGTAGQSHWKNINYADGGGSTDYMGITLYARGGVWFDLDHVLFGTGPGQWGQGFVGATTTPGAFFAPSGGLTLTQLSVQVRGIVLIPSVSGINVNVNGQSRAQGNITPFITVFNVAGGSGKFVINGVDIDTSSQAKFCALGGSNFYTATVQVGLSGDPSFGGTAVTGNPIGLGLTGTTSGQNNTAIVDYNFTNSPVNVTGIGEFMMPIKNTVPPTLSVSAGGSVPTNQPQGYAITMIDVNGNESVPGPIVPITLTPGNQTVTITAPPPPPGAVGWRAYRGSPTAINDRIFADCTISGVPYRTSTVDTVAFSCLHPNDVPVFNRAGAQSISAAGISGTQFNLTSNGFSTAITSNLTTSRTISIPDASGTLALQGAGNPTASATWCGVAFGTLTTGSVASFTPSVPITVMGFGYQLSAGQTLGAGCTQQPSVHVTDGTTTSPNLTLANNTASGHLNGLSLAYPANTTTLRIEINFTSTGCSTAWGNVNLWVEYHT